MAVALISKERFSMVSAAPPIHDIIKPLSWLLGKWQADDGKGYYPPITDFLYGEELEFFHVGQPVIQFTANSCHAETKQKLHRECGFMRIQPGTSHVAFLCAQNAGLTEVSEGEMKDKEIHLQSHTVGRLTFAKQPAVKKISRTFKLLENGNLEQVVCMETSNTPMTEHLKITYKKFV